MKKVRVRVLPKAQAGMNFTSPGAHPSYNQVFAPGMFYPADTGSEQSLSVRKTLNPVDREHATLEAEKGETAVTSLAKNGIPEFYKIGGNRHSAGGTPLNLPPDSFIFSRDNKMKIYDKDVLAQFGKNVKKRKGFTPADLSKNYDLNEYQKILADPDSTKMERETAELMIQNFNQKLGQLALLQESIKGFPDGIPGIAMPYLAVTGIDPKELIQPPAQEQMPQQIPMRKGGIIRSNNAIEPTGSAAYSNMRPDFQYGGPLKRKVRLTGLPEYQDGKNVPVTSSKSTRRQNIPATAKKWDAAAPDYDESKVKPGDYILENGVWKKVNGYKTKEYDYKDPRLGELQAAYGHLQQTITGNKDLQDAIYENYKKHIEQGQLSASEKEKLLNIPPQQVIQKFLDGQKQVYAINNAGVLYEKDEKGKLKRDASGNPIMKSEKDLKKWETLESEEYKKAAKDLGFENEIFTGEDTAVFQAAYKGLEDSSKDSRFAKIFENFNITPVGLKDTHGLHTYNDKPISPVDKYFGNTTAGQAVLPKELDKELVTTEADWIEDEIEQKKPQVKHFTEQYIPQNAPWWLQDIVKTAGSAGDFFRVKKHAPWQATPGIKLATPTFQDPTRQLAANAELAGIATQGAGAFAGPQAFNARAAQIQGQAATNAANTLAGVHGQNVQIANQFEMANTELMNRASDRKSQLATQLYDKNTILNQQFENEKNLARQMVRQNYIDAITNRAQTQTMNQLYDQYMVDPASGGFLHFTNGKPVTPKKANTTGIMDRAAEYKRLNPGWDDNSYIQAAKADAGIKDEYPWPGYGVNPASFAYPGSIPQGYYQE